MQRYSIQNAATLRATMLVAGLAGALALAACGGGNDGPSQTQQLDAAALSPGERAVAEALIDGFGRETGSDAVSPAEVGRAVCYARIVEMPTEYDDVHRRYLADYAAIDADFYPWFEANAVAAQDAWDIAERVRQGFEACPQSDG